MRHLALILFLPAFAILVWLYWTQPRTLPRTPSRRRFDTAALALALLATVFAVGWAIDHSARDADAGPIWPQVAASLAAFHVFPFALGLAAWLRQRLWGLRRD